MQKITSKAVQGAVHSLKVLEFQGLTTFYESVGRGFESLRAHQKSLGIERSQGSFLFQSSIAKNSKKQYHYFWRADNIRK